MRYREPLYRPPAEADSLIFQVSFGCPHNSCRFCPMYKGIRHEVRGKDELFADIDWAARRYPETRRIFLADGDAMSLPFAWLEEILAELSLRFPLLSRVSLYANGSSILAKTDAELAALRSLKLDTLYVGLESGDEELLRLVRKGETAAGMADAVVKAQAAGLRCSVMILLGLGGRGETAARHARATAAVINKMRPRLLSALRFVQAPGLPMFDGFQAASEADAVRELRSILAGLELDGTVFRANHASNPVPLGGRLPKDKAALVAGLDALIDFGALDEKGSGDLPLFL